MGHRLFGLVAEKRDEKEEWATMANTARALGLQGRTALHRVAQEVVRQSYGLSPRAACSPRRCAPEQREGGG